MLRGSSLNWLRNNLEGIRHRGRIIAALKNNLSMFYQAFLGTRKIRFWSALSWLAILVFERSPVYSILSVKEEQKILQVALWIILEIEYHKVWCKHQVSLVHLSFELLEKLKFCGSRNLTKFFSSTLYNWGWLWFKIFHQIFQFFFHALKIWWHGFQNFRKFYRPIFKNI